MSHRGPKDTATLTDLDKMERLMPGSGWKELMARAQVFDDAQRFNDPGKKYTSIKNPSVYEALRKKGYSKSKAAAISNSK